MLAYPSFLLYFLILVQKYIYEIFQNKNFLEDIVQGFWMSKQIVNNF